MHRKSNEKTGEIQAYERVEQFRLSQVAAGMQAKTEKLTKHTMYCEGNSNEIIFQDEIASRFG